MNYFSPQLYIQFFLICQSQIVDNLDLYLNPTIKNLLPNPLHLKDMDVALERTFQSIENNEFVAGSLGSSAYMAACTSTVAKKSKIKL